MPQAQRKFAWELMVELRDELVELQRLRSQAIGFKITFVSAVIGFIAANLDTAPIQLFVIPAFAAIFFDLVITGHSNSIKRIGLYCRHYLEPIIRESSDWPSDTPLWEEYLTGRKTRTTLVIIGILGITGLAVMTAIVVLFLPFNRYFSPPLLVALVAFYLYDLISFQGPEKIRRTER